MNRNQGQDKREILAGLGLSLPETDPVDRIDARIVEHAFGETANPDDYVPRPACDEVLGRLERIVFDLGAPAALIAPPGMGKSLLLRVFARRVSHRARPIELAYGALSFEDLCEWTLSLFGEEVTGLPSDDLQHVLKRRDLLLSIDDASSLPSRTVRGLRFLAQHRPRLHIVLAASDGSETTRMLAAFGETLQRVQLSSPMDADEALAYMTHRLTRWGASGEMIERLPEGISRLLHLSGGVPRRVHNAAHRVFALANSSASGSWSDDAWLADSAETMNELGEPNT